MPDLPRNILVTGANGNLGRQLLSRLAELSGQGASQPIEVRALVRSESAAAQVRAIPGPQPPEIMIGDYTDPASMAQAVAGCAGIVHLVGIIKEGAGATYASAHEKTCRVLEAAAAEAGCQRIVYLSILGSHEGASNACLASKGAAEAILLAGRVPSTVLRVPMVLGPDDFASRALASQAQARAVALVGGGATLQQPIDSRDVVAAIVAALSDAKATRLGLDLGGPECLSHRALLLRVAELHGANPRVIPIPLTLARIFAAALARLSANPPITPAMLEILQHDDRLDPEPACQALGIQLTPLIETLRAYTGPEVKKHD
ncbi:MAG: NAD(P)H-binding protein [Myxococcota bacterium]|nr:NAD(P)H-binding protein [Myxococcota bacterium]